jgi:hypothetical protein
MKGAAGEVADAEKLYRRVSESVGEQLCYKVEGDRVFFLHAAFNDPAKSPSVDRAALADGDPHRTRRTSADGIVTLHVDAVRRIGPIPKFNEKGKRLKEVYGVNVSSDPVLGDCAHALIEITPPNGSTGAFKKLKEALTRLATEAGWTVQPQSPLPPRTDHPLSDTFRCLLNRVKGRL